MARLLEADLRLGAQFRLDAAACSPAGREALFRSLTVADDENERINALSALSALTGRLDKEHERDRSIIEGLRGIALNPGKAVTVRLTASLAAHRAEPNSDFSAKYVKSVLQSANPDLLLGLTDLARDNLDVLENSEQLKRLFDAADADVRRNTVAAVALCLPKRLSADEEKWFTDALPSLLRDANSNVRFTGGFLLVRLQARGFDAKPFFGAIVESMKSETDVVDLGKTAFLLTKVSRSSFQCPLPLDERGKLRTDVGARQELERAQEEIRQRALGWLARQ
jgi:hypothetical protein